MCLFIYEFVLLARSIPLIKEICKTIELRLKYEMIPTRYTIHLEAAFAGGLNKMVIELLGIVDAPRVDDNLSIRDGLTALHLAAKYGQHEMLSNMLRRPGVNVNKLSRIPPIIGNRLRCDYTPLFLAVKHGNVCCAEVLLLNGAHLEKIGTSLLPSSAFRGYNEMVRLLLRNGMDLFPGSYRGHNVLECALLNYDEPDPGTFNGRLSASTVWQLVTQVALVGGAAPRKVVEARREPNIVFDLGLPIATDKEEFMRNAKNEPREWRELMAMERRRHTIVNYKE